MKSEFKAAVEWLESSEARLIFRNSENAYIGEMYTIKSDLCGQGFRGEDYCECGSDNPALSNQFYSVGEFTASEEKDYMKTGYVRHPHEGYVMGRVY